VRRCRRMVRSLLQGRGFDPFRLLMVPWRLLRVKEQTISMTRAADRRRASGGRNASWAVARRLALRSDVSARRGAVPATNARFITSQAALEPAVPLGNLPGVPSSLGRSVTSDVAACRECSVGAASCARQAFPRTSTGSSSPSSSREARISGARKRAASTSAPWRTTGAIGATVPPSRRTTASSRAAY
jgi:hypothetical protein